MYQDPSQRQNPYSGYGDVPPSSHSYGIPPSQSSQPLQPDLYGTPPNYQQQNYGTAYGTPVVSVPLPFGEAVRQLPNQYIKVLTKPSVLTFDQEKGKAAWNIVWVQLFILGLAITILSFFVTLISPTSSSQSGSPLFAIILTPLIFFIGLCPYYLIAKAFKGEGTYLQQGYTLLLFFTPLAIIVGILIAIPILGAIVFLALIVYANVLNIFSIMSVHRLSGGKATAAALLPGMVAILLFCGLFAAFIALLASSMKH